jgi:hypothetical protein
MNTAIDPNPCNPAVSIELRLRPGQSIDDAVEAAVARRDRFRGPTPENNRSTFAERQADWAQWNRGPFNQ